jgi:Tol biopolymer transport system component
MNKGLAAAMLSVCALLVSSVASADEPVEGPTFRLLFTRSGTSTGYDLHTANPDGTDVVRVTNFSGGERPTHMSVTTDGRVVYMRGGISNPDIYSTTLVAPVATRLTTASREDCCPVWLPDGTRIVFESQRYGNFEIMAMDPFGTNQVRLTSNRTFDGTPTISPDGTKIAWRQGNDIWVMNADGSGQTRITFGNAKVSRVPAWSPDGTKIAFSSNRDGNDEIYTMNPDGTGVTRLTVAPGADLNPAWSPDSQRIAWYSNRDGNDEIYVMNADGSNVVRVTTNTVSDILPSWYVVAA